MKTTIGPNGHPQQQTLDNEEACSLLASVNRSKRYTMNDPVFILYKVSNSDADAGDPCFNAFVLPNGVKPTLASVKQHCTALYGLNHLGPEGYHWRVCLQDRPIPGEAVSSDSSSWWDIQDENASLPIKETTQYQLQKFLNPPKEDASSDTATKAAKATFKSLGKAMSQAVGGDGDSGPPVKVVAFKLLDLIKVNDDFTTKHNGTSAGPAIASPAPQRATARQQKAPAPQQRAQQQQRAPQQRAAQRPPQQRQQQRPPSEPSLMDFGAAPSASAYKSPSAPSNESRAAKLKREYAQKQQTASRVWDEIDQRWVDKDATAAAKSNEPVPKKKEVGITLDPANAIGKSANVQAAVQDRVDNMKREQNKAVQEVREREAKKKQQENEEDEVRKRLEPKIKVWSEEHGKKKQLRALLASLHTILWPGAKWKQVTIGDLLDDKKVLRSFQRASLVVHPDKTGHLDSEKRFLAKRIFDALCQAKAQFDDGK